MANKLNEEKAVNEVQLKDIFDASSKVEQSIISLVGMAINFSSADIKQGALILKSKAHELTTKLSNAMMGQADVVDDSKLDLEGGKEGSLLGESATHECDDQMTESWKDVNGEKGEKIDPINEDADQDFQVDLAEAYRAYKPAEFDTFKSKVVSIFESTIPAITKKIGSIKSSEFQKSINALKESKNVSSYEGNMNKIYDFADVNNIEIKTV